MRFGKPTQHNAPIPTISPNSPPNKRRSSGQIKCPMARKSKINALYTKQKKKLRQNLYASRTIISYTKISSVSIPSAKDDDASSSVFPILSFFFFFVFLHLAPPANGATNPTISISATTTKTTTTTT